MSGSNQPLKLVDREFGGAESEATNALWEAYEVPQLLAALRDHAGLSIEDVAAALHIRAVYLRAIEDCRFDDLPGPTYAVGFVRAYADHLGLDPDTTVRRFKAERDGISRRPELFFPTPVPEARVPGRSLIGLSVVLAIMVYGGWYYLSSQDRSVIEVVEQVPASLEAALFGKVAPESAAADAPAPEVAPTAAPPSPIVMREAVNPVAAAMLGEEIATPPDTAPNPETMDPPSVFSMAAPVAVDLDPMAPIAAASVPAQPLKQMMAAAQISPDEAAAATPAPLPPAPPSDGLNGTADEATIETEQIAATTTGIAPRDYGAAQGEARIVLQATEDNWIQVRSRTNQAIFTRILRPGDRYHVPGDTGLTLKTGKAGALVVMVDGQRLNSLGPVDAVRGGISLEPGALLRELGPVVAAGG